MNCGPRKPQKTSSTMTSFVLSKRSCLPICFSLQNQSIGFSGRATSESPRLCCSISWSILVSAQSESEAVWLRPRARKLELRKELELGMRPIVLKHARHKRQEGPNHLRLQCRDALCSAEEQVQRRSSPHRPQEADYRKMTAQTSSFSIPGGRT